ncbi:MAG: Asp-tRNA(Asn)/Glu-tRNA(Gln) amidotransferase subunit GatC [Alphaproteobacteria bacterium]|nr:Asp-tRNA(Asn)/Glu-tRNA(Gln) amidotransferase subunit GatC [Alphaproteobacteria bacterium]
MDTKDVLKVARLARIETTEAQAEALLPQLNNIIGWIEQLSEVDTDNVEPLANVANIELPLRKDEVSDGNCADKVLANAPDEMQGFFSVPKVVE